jgi:hydroxyacylglutathione hydrolase
MPAPWSLLAIPAFTDNYFWLMHDGTSALVVDPGEAGPVLEAMAALRLAHPAIELKTILVTHHHPDHTGGVAALARASGAQVVAPAAGVAQQRYAFTPDAQVVEGGQVDVLGLRFAVMEVPGHTLDHVAYFCADPRLGAPLLFCGDTLFSGGCGRLFEGTPQQMLGSLDKLAALPASTRVCCTHEYTLSNLRFARAADPGNLALAEHQARCVALREHGQMTLPSTIALERAINPFLRVREPALVAAAQAQGAQSDAPPAVFAALREWKNTYR